MNTAIVVTELSDRDHVLLASMVSDEVGVDRAHRPRRRRARPHAL